MSTPVWLLKGPPLKLRFMPKVSPRAPAAGMMNGPDQLRSGVRPA